MTPFSSVVLLLQNGFGLLDGSIACPFTYSPTPMLPRRNSSHDPAENGIGSHVHKISTWHRFICKLGTLHAVLGRELHTPKRRATPFGHLYLRLFSSAILQTFLLPDVSPEIAKVMTSELHQSGWTTVCRD